MAYCFCIIIQNTQWCKDIGLLILLIVDDDTGEYDKNCGSYKSGKLLVSLSAGITVIVCLFCMYVSTNESVMASQLN